MSFRRALSAPLCLLLLFATGTGSGEAAPAPRPACVWKIRGGQNIVYIAGSVHLLREKDYPLPPAYDIAYQDSSRLFFEIDMQQVSKPGTVEKMQRLGMYSSKDNLRRHVSEGTFKLLTEYLTGHGLPTLLFERTKPGLLAINLASMEALRMGARPDLGLEAIYHRKSLKDKKPSDGLESVEFQVTLFDQLNDREQDRMLRATLEKIAEMQSTLNDLIEAWKKGDVKTLDILLNKEFKEDPNLRELLIDKRNRSWIPQIERAFHGRENVLFIVGVGHLVGKGSVIDLLEQRGYVPIQMSSAVAEPVAAE